MKLTATARLLAAFMSRSVVRMNSSQSLRSFDPQTLKMPLAIE